jgi:hypothetical protein
MRHNGIFNGCLTKIIVAAFALFVLTQCACGTQAQLPTATPTAVSTHVTVVPTGTAKSVSMETHIYTNTKPLYVRSCAGMCEPPLASLPIGTEITVEVMDIPGKDCAGGSWWAVEAGGVAGFVCSLYIEER